MQIFQSINCPRLISIISTDQLMHSNETRQFEMTHMPIHLKIIVFSTYFSTMDIRETKRAA